MASLAVRVAGRLAQGLGRQRDRRFQTRLRHAPGAPVLLLSPHPDDAALDCWSVLTGPGEVRVVNVFAGVPPPGRVTSWDAVVGASDSAELMRERLREDAAALAQAGRRPVNLAFLEHPQRAHRPEPAHRALDAALSGAVPLVSRVLAPMALGTVHPDHRLLREYALAVARAGVPVTLYADVPYATVYGWPHWVTGAPREPRLDVDAYWAPSLSAVPRRGETRVVHLAAEQAARKLAALRTYGTQFPSLDRGPVGQLSNPAVHCYEVFWDVP